MDILAFIFSLFFVFLFSFCFFFLCHTLKSVDALLNYCIFTKLTFQEHLSKSEDNKDYFTGRLEQNKLLFYFIKYYFKFLFSKKGWKKYENNWNSEHQL